MVFLAITLLTVECIFDDYNDICRDASEKDDEHEMNHSISLDPSPSENQYNGIIILELINFLLNLIGYAKYV